ncbi:hypothetical protein G6011_09938 [Alternaria panax]|uniref:DUF7905 domain-containing protein n=1 Tax=Alternaria panax TaxID=48097 RepID=A0AAD4FCF9_9PLEO|nr:hypothetical protein G6011_09938 [Alternaria panax]
MSTTTLPKLSSPRRHYFDTASTTLHHKEAVAMDADNTGPVPRPKPNKIIPVPQEFRRLTHARERDNIVNDVNISTGCVVIPQWDDGRIYQFGIAGGGAGLEKAVRYINQWISNAHVKSKDSSAWAKMPAFDPNKWYYEQVEEMERQRKETFRGMAPKVSEGETPLQRFIMHWPEDLINQGITPRDVFGNKLEVLDAIRTHDEVFISLLSAQGDVSQIEVQAADVANIEAAEAHLKTMIDKVKAEAMGLHNTLNMILDDQEGIEVQLEEADGWWPNLQDRVVPRLLPNLMMESPGSFRGDVMHFVQLSKIQRSVQLALDAVRHKKGAYDMTIRLGSLALNSRHVKENEIGKKYMKDVFLKSINGSVGLDIKKWLADDVLGSQILESFYTADEFLQPTKSSDYFGHMPKSLRETRPMFRGTWVFADPSTATARPPQATATRHSGRPNPFNQASVSTASSTPAPAVQSSLIVVQVDWTDDEEGLYEKNTTRFYKTEQGRLGPTKSMDINLLELGESRGWHFALESLIPVASKSISPVITGFAERVKMKPDHDHRSTESFAEWDLTPTVKKYLQMGRLDTIYSFSIKNTCYKVEATCMWYPRQKLPVWGLSVRHPEWATHLAELERLPVGRKADWGHTISTFLPDDGQSSYSSAVKDEDFGMRSLNLGPDVEAPPRDGIRILMDKLLQLSAIVSSVMDMGGVSI